MGKRIIQQRRGRGTSTYRVRKKAYIHEIAYPPLNEKGIAKVTDIINSVGHSAPLIKFEFNKRVYYTPAPLGICVGESIQVNTVNSNANPKPGDILKLTDMPVGTNIYNIEIRPGSGGELIRCGGLSGRVVKKEGNKVLILMPSKRKKLFNNSVRATVGIIAGFGRKEKPWVKAGNKYYAMKAKGKLYPRTSAVKMNIVDHPFGSGRGKHIKSKIAKRNAPPGARVGLIRPRRTGKRKK